MPSATETRDDTGRESPGRGRWLTTAAVGFLLLAVVGSLVVVLWPSPDEGGGQSASPPAGGNGGVVPTPGSTAVPTTPPEGVTWELVNGIAIPRSATAGPTQIDGPVHHGFAHTPEGALMAALQISTRLGWTPGEGWREVTQEQVMPGPGREVYIDAREKVASLEPPQDVGQTAGFRFVSYSPQRAVIDVATGFESGNLQVTAHTVVWHRGDWRLQLQPNGELGPYTSAVPDLSGFVKFSGV